MGAAYGARELDWFQFHQDLFDKHVDGLAPEAQPFIVKINIEGFESELFSRNTEWIKSFPIIILGLHDFMLPGQGGSNNFLRRISMENRDFIPLGENIVSITNGGVGNDSP